MMVLVSFDLLELLFSYCKCNIQGAVLDGYGWFLRDQTSRISKVNKFLRKVPDFQVH